MHSAFHGPAEHYATLELLGHVFGYELGIDLRLADFPDVHVNLFAGHAGELFFNLIDLSTAPTYHHSRAGGQNLDTHALGGSLDENLSHSSTA